jgi:hypothetical protein
MKCSLIKFLIGNNNKYINIIIIKNGVQTVHTSEKDCCQENKDNDLNWIKYII